MKYLKKIKYILIFVLFSLNSCKSQAQVCLRVDCADSIPYLTSDTLHSIFTGDTIISRNWTIFSKPTNSGLPTITTPDNLITQVSNFTLPGLYVFQQNIQTKDSIYTKLDSITVLPARRIAQIYTHNNSISVYEDGSIQTNELFIPKTIKKK